MSKRKRKPPVRRATEQKTSRREETSERKSASANRKSATSPKTRKKPKKNIYTAKDLLFGKDNYVLMIGGLVLIIIGMMLMNGGGMADENTWNSDSIYSFRRITLAPLVILLGLGLEIVAIFKQPKEETVVTTTTEE